MSNFPLQLDEEVEMLCEVCAVDVRYNPIGGETMQCFRVSLKLSH